MKKILLVDDDVDLVEINRDYLLTKGYSVVTALNGRDGIKTALEEKPDLVVLDVMMTDVGEGFEVARALRENVKTRSIPILMLTGVNREHGFNLVVGPDETWNPVDEFLDKPVTHEELLKKISQMLGE
ncbi:response regulator [candidate division KSB1 bacterium]|nr:response regulator [candidate division KSB1 bacterium]